MPEGRLKSGTFRKIKKKLPGGKTVTHYKKKKPGKAKCSECGAVLNGVKRKRAVKMRNLAKTKKRPERPYGGVLCSKCSRRKIKSKIRK